MECEASLDPRPPVEGVLVLTPEQQALLPRLRGSNVNETTFLATDYLNHLNEAVMMIELVPSMPDMLEDALAWRPKSYQQHFQGGELAIADLAVEAYEIAPERYRLPFDLTVKAINRRIAKTLETLEPLVDQGDSVKTGLAVLEACKAIQDLIGVASAIVNGSERVDDCSGSAPPPVSEEPDPTTMSQSDIDALFN